MLDLDLGRTNVVIVERIERLSLCVTLDPEDDRPEIIKRFKPEGKEWNFSHINDHGDYAYLHYHKMTHPAT